MPSHSTTVGPCYGVRKKSKPKRPPSSERPKHIHRGRKARTHEQSNNKTIKFYYVNLNGYRSKKERLKHIIEENNIHILLLTETKVYSKTAIKLNGFQVFPVVRTKRYGSGLTIGLEGRNVLQKLNQYKLSNVIKEPTRITNTTNTLQNLVITSNRSKISKAGTHETGIADHRLVYTIIKLTKMRNPSKTRTVVD